MEIIDIYVLVVFGIEVILDYFSFVVYRNIEILEILVDEIFENVFKNWFVVDI